MATPEERLDLVEQKNLNDSFVKGKLFKEVGPSGLASLVGNDKAGLANF